MNVSTSAAQDWREWELEVKDEARCLAEEKHAADVAAYLEAWMDDQAEKDSYLSYLSYISA